MINCILGKSKTGKTTHIYNMIEDDMKQDKKVILFVPSQSRAKAEEEYMQKLNKSGIIGVNITTISEFVLNELKLQNLHIEDRYMSKLDRKIILTQVIKENPELFNVFNKVKNYAGFLDVLDIYMDLLRKSDISFEELSLVETGDKRTDTKFKEIVAIYEKYLEKITTVYIDSVEEMDIYMENFSKSQWFSDIKNISVYFDGYNNFSNSEYKLIDKLLKQNIDITISLNTDITKIEDTYLSSSIFEVPNNTYKRICALANKNNISLENIVKYENYLKAEDDLKFIANNLFCPSEQVEEKVELENVEIKLFTNAIKEIENVAKIIATKVKEGYKYSDFAVYTTNPEEYEKIIYRIFYENNIEIYLDKRRNLSESMLVKYIQGVLNLAVKGLNLELIFDILKQGLAQFELKDIYILENYMKEFNVNKYLVTKEFKLNNERETYDLEKLNSIKDKVQEMYGFVLNIKKATAKEIINQIYYHLTENNIFNNYFNMTETLKEDIYSIEMSNFESQVWDRLREIFDSIVKVYKDTELTAEEFSNIFNLVVKDISIKTVPPTKDNVELIDINVSKSHPKKIAFFIGVVEGKFPKKVDEDILFLDSELENLKDKQVEIKETTISKLNMGFFNIYEALNNITEKLYISIPSANLDGKATRKSSLITLLQQIANFHILGDVTSEDDEYDLYNATSKDELFMSLIKAIKNIDDKSDISQIFNVYKYFMADEKYSEILNFRRDSASLSKEITDIIYSDEFKSSVSKLEQYKKCPFSYYMMYVLNVKPNKEAKVNVLELGSFMHLVLETFSRELLDKNIAWQSILTEELDGIKEEYEKILEQIINDCIDKFLSKQKQSVKYMVLKRKLVNTMKKVIRTIALSYNQSEFKPYDYEIKFEDDCEFLPMQIELDNGKIMKIIGKIDRVDMLELEDKAYIRVLDYKSSGKDLNISKIKEGISLQLISYMMAFMNNKKESNIVPAGMVYFNLSDKLVALSQYENDNEKLKKELKKALKMNGIFLKDIEILNKMDRNFETNPSDSLIDVTKSSITRNSSKVLEEKEFSDLCDEVKEALKKIGKEISNGVVKIEPNKKENYCQYCKYSSTCRKNISV